jgi:nicotinamidase/pyrazinamidase
MARQTVRRIVFFDVDTQYDFMAPAGRLYVKGAASIAGNLKKITAFADRHGIPVISSLDWHTAHDPEFASFPKHCVRNTPGARKIPATIAAATKQIMIKKSTLDVFSNPAVAKALSKFSDVYVYGVALDYCVKTACLGARRQGLRVYMVRDAVKAISPKTGKAAADVLRRHAVRFITMKGLQRRLAL